VFSTFLCPSFLCLDFLSRHGTAGSTFAFCTKPTFNFKAGSTANCCQQSYFHMLSTVVDHISDTFLTLPKILDGKKIFLQLFVHLQTLERGMSSSLHCQK
jgi:hypothetical protein